MSQTFYVPCEQTPAIQKLLGGVPRSTILGALGAPGSGKSTLFMQVCVEVAKSEKGNILIFDTENKHAVFMHLCAGLSARFGIDLNPVRVRGNVKKGGTPKESTYSIEWELEDDVDPKATNVFIVYCPDIMPLSTMWGRGFRLKVAQDSGKFKVVMLAGAWVDDVEDVPVARFILKNKIKVVLIDSVTNPFDEIPAVSENFPARTDGTQALMVQVHKVAAEYRLPVLATFHESKNDTAMFSKELKVEGGKGVTYNIAYLLYCLIKNEKGLLPAGAAKPKIPMSSDERAVYVARLPVGAGGAPWRDVEYVTITEKGMVSGGSGTAASSGSSEEDEKEEEVETIPPARKIPRRIAVATVPTEQHED